MNAKKGLLWIDHYPQFLTHCCVEGQGVGGRDMNETMKLSLGRKGEGKVLF